MGGTRAMLLAPERACKTTWQTLQSLTRGFAFQTDLLHDALLVIVAKGAAQLVVVHGWPVLLDPPQPGYLQDKATKHVDV